MRTNVAASNAPRPETHEGGVAERQNPLTELRRSVLNCMLFENTFYESGNDIADRIASLCLQVKPEEIMALARSARNDMRLRHVPLWLIVQLVKRADANREAVRQTVCDVIQRPDEMGEALALFARSEGRNDFKKLNKLPHVLTDGIARAFTKFDEYQISKWDRDSLVKLRDVLFVVHPKPKDKEQEALWKRLVDKTLSPPDTWEVGLSAAKTDEEKKAVWNNLLAEKRLGSMGLIMNIRNMDKVGVDSEKIEKALREAAPRSKALPFRYVSASKAAPMFSQALSDAMVMAVDKEKKLKGTTYLVIDVSASMDAPISSRSTLDRWEAAGALGILLAEICDRFEAFTFSSGLVPVPSLRGLGLIDAVNHSQGHGWTALGESLRVLKSSRPTPERVIVITDEQARDGNIPCWAKHGYIVNVAPYQPGLVTASGWHRVNGWSERIVDWVYEVESDRY